MGNLMSLMNAQISFLQIIIIAYVGALIGESQREIEDDVEINFLKFISSWMSSGFLGVLIGFLTKEFIFQDKPLAVLSLSGFFGYTGNKKSTTFITNLIGRFTNNGGNDSGQDTKKE